MALVSVLITGANSYLGMSVHRHLLEYPDLFTADELDMMSDAWREHDFSRYDAVYHVAGIAHIGGKSKSEAVRERYNSVNAVLAVETARKAKLDGVKHFIFMSSSNVYGESSKIGQSKLITADTSPAPTTDYGKSKLSAEIELMRLADDNFTVAILRSPTIYGPDCRGNYPLLSKWAHQLNWFPDIDNQRSMLYIGHLCIFIRHLLIRRLGGVFHPQNKQYVCVSEMVAGIARENGRNLRLTRAFNKPIALLGKRVDAVNKVFGSLAYDQALSEFPDDYRPMSLTETIRETERVKTADVMILCDNCIDTVGGEQESVKIIMDGLSDKYSFCVVQPGRVKGYRPYKIIETIDETRLKHAIRKPFTLLRFFRKMRRAILTERPLVVHSQSQLCFFAAALLKRLRLIPRDTVLLHTERGLYTKYSGFILRLFLTSLKSIDALITTTSHNKEMWSEALADKNIIIPIRVIENTAGPFFDGASPSAERTDDGITIGFAGRYCDWKNWDMAYDVALELSKLTDRFSVHIAIGYLDEKSHAEAEALCARLSELLHGRLNVRYNLALRDMADYYRGIDVLIVTSRPGSESFGRTVVEAMSERCAVLSTPSGGPEEILDRQDLIMETAPEFAKALYGFIQQPESLESLKDYCERRVRAKYSNLNNLSKYDSLYWEYIASRGGTVRGA